MKLTRKLLCLLLALAMVMTLTPAVAFAEEVTEEAEADRIEATVPAEEAEADRIEATVPEKETDDVIPETGPVTVEIPFQINPLYEGLITKADLDIPELPEWDPEQVQLNAGAYATMENAAKELRKQLKNRNETFTIYVKAESADAQAVSDSMLEIALEHTGVATEGDYIAWQFGGYGGQGSRRYNEKTQMYEYTLEFAAAYYTTADQERKVTSAVYNLINSLNLWSKSDYDKIYAVYDWLCKNVTYDYENLEDTTYMLKHTAYAALIDRTAVCQGYAVLFYRLMLELGVDARVIVGDGGGPHAWNIVQLGDYYYNLDSTWDAGQSEYAYFLRSNWTFGNHYREPQCDTWEFHMDHPMAAEYYQEGVKATLDPYINAGLCGDYDENYLNAAWVMMRDGSLYIEGERRMCNYNTVQLPYWYIWKDHLKKVYIGEGITSVGSCAFRQMNVLEEVYLPETLTTISSEAFYQCTNLSVITIPDAVTYIGSHAFRECLGLTKLELSRNLNSLGGYAFDRCANLKEIWFRGDAPKFSSAPLYYVVADAYYPSNNYTWTEDVLQDYGGTINWIGYEPYCSGHEYEGVVTEPTCYEQGYTTYTCIECGHRYIDDYTEPVDHNYEHDRCKWCGRGKRYAKFSSISTSLGGNIAMNFYLELSEDMAKSPNAYIKFNYADREVRIYLRDGKATEKNGTTVYLFSCPITSKNMTDEITAQVYDAAGKVGDPKTMSVDTYCNWVIENFTDDKTVNLMKAMLNYGASAQILFNYRTDDLANASLAEEDKVFCEVDASAFAHSRTGEAEGIEVVSYTLLLDSETTIRCYFRLTGDRHIADYTFTVDGVVVAPQRKDGKYYIEKKNISAHRLDDMHVFTCDGITVTYGGLSYVNQVMTYYTSGTTFDMASALYAYSKAAEAYIG